MLKFLDENDKVKYVRSYNPWDFAPFLKSDKKANIISTLLKHIGEKFEVIIKIIRKNEIKYFNLIKLDSIIEKE